MLWRGGTGRVGPDGRRRRDRGRRCAAGGPGRVGGPAGHLRRGDGDAGVFECGGLASARGGGADPHAGPHKGLDVVALDLRGHGQSALGGLDYKNFETEEWLGCAKDIRAALDYLAEQVSGKYFLIGASIGANLALIEAAGDDRVTGVIMLSPGSDFHGVRPGEYATDYGERPALLVAAVDDDYSARSVSTLGGLLSDPELKIYPSGGHGTYLFVSRPEVRALIADWLEKRLSE
ncbi:MAG: alpha/beta fold hydrolase [bacterium]|nr:alpha/beta fold hydrolase [bacterium]